MQSLLENIQNGDVRRIVGCIRLATEADKKEHQALRRTGAEALKDMAVSAPDRIRAAKVDKDLLMLLRNADIIVRKNVLEALDRLGWQSFKDKDLAKLLNHPDRVVRRRMFELLNELGWRPPGTHERIDYLVAKEDWDGLAEIGQPAVKPLISRFGDYDTDTSLNMVRVIRKTGNAGAIDKAIDKFAESCLRLACVYRDDRYTDDYGTRGQGAAEALVDVAERAVPQLVKKMGNARVRDGAVDMVFGPFLRPACVYRDDRHTDDYGTRVQKAAEALADVGEQAVPQLVKRIKESCSFAIPAVWALCKIGDRQATEAVLDWIFRFGRGPCLIGESPILVGEQQPMSSGGFLRVTLPTTVLSQLLGDYSDLILDIFSWNPTMSAEWFDMSTCSEAVQRLCAIKTPVSSNVLHKVAKTHSFTVGYSPALDFTTVHYLDCRSSRQMAEEELKRRGKPRYDPSAYLSPDAWRL